MKAVFGILSLLIVLAVLALTAKHQLQATLVSLPPDAVAAGASTPTGTVADQSRALQERVRTDTLRALQQGTDRAASADQ